MGTNYYIYLKVSDIISSWTIKQCFVGNSRALNLRPVVEFFHDIVYRIKENNLSEKLQLANFDEIYTAFHMLKLLHDNDQLSILLDYSQNISNTVNIESHTVNINNFKDYILRLWKCIENSYQFEDEFGNVIDFNQYLNWLYNKNTQIGLSFWISKLY